LSVFVLLKVYMFLMTITFTNWNPFIVYRVQEPQVVPLH